MLSAYGPLDVYDTTWALLWEINEAEVTAPMRELAYSILVAGIVIAVIVALSAYFVAAMIARPMVKGVSFAQGDEVGMLADSLRDMVQRLKEVVREISAAGQNASSGSKQISKGIAELDQVTQQNASQSEEMSSMAEELSSQAEQLESSISFFTVNENGQMLAIESSFGQEQSRLDAPDRQDAQPGEQQQTYQ